MKEEVSLVHCGGYERDKVEEAVGRALALLGGAAGIVRPGQSVFVKTNAVLAQPPESAMTTHPEVVRALVLELMRVTPDVTVGDSPGGPFTPSFLKRVYEKTGIAAVARDTGCKLGLDTRVAGVACPDGVAVKRLELCRAMVEADVLVSVSKLKSHRFLNVTGPVKNLYGAVPGLTKMSYHSAFENGGDFADLIVDVHLAAMSAGSSPGFHLLDAIDVIEGDGARRGTIRRMGALAAGRDAFAVEALALRLAGLPPEASKPLAAAVRRGACPPGADWFEVLGDPPGSFSSFKERSFALPPENVFGEKTLARVARRWTRLFAVTPYPLPGACTRCGRCVEICPRGAISLGPGPGAGVSGPAEPARVDTRKCIRCFCCDELCEFKAIEMRRPALARLMRRGGGG